MQLRRDRAHSRRSAMVGASCKRDVNDAVERQTGGVVGPPAFEEVILLDVIGNQDFKVKRSGNGLVAYHAWYEAVLTHGSEDACVHARTR